MHPRCLARFNAASDGYCIGKDVFLLWYFASDSRVLRMKPRGDRPAVPLFPPDS
ncbi:MAG: hypothetical protein OJF47_000914 [Nitrospira sp.]|nr:MAG: hypothetical protein OJF47_000914 [Nitrospira sp.]